MARIALSALLILIANFAWCQVASVVNGVVLDHITHTPIADVHILGRNSGTISARNGEFQLNLHASDSIYFSHVGYEEAAIAVPKVFSAQDTLYVYLSPKTRVLDEVFILPHATEERFKSEILKTVPVISKEQEIANQNSVYMREISKIAPPAPQTPAEQYFEALNGPKGVTIFSTNGNGLIKALKNLGHQPQYRYTPANRSGYQTNSVPLRIFRIKRNSVATDSTDMSISRQDSLNQKK